MALVGRFALAGLLLAACPWASALNPELDVSQYAHFSWKYRDGFAKGNIESMAQTSDGYLWLGTTSGLLRFDGVKPVPWEPPPGQPLPSKDIMHVLAARDGTLWIGTRSGLASWSSGKLTRYPELAGSQIGALLEDREGSVWAGAYGRPDGKLCEIREGRVRCDPEFRRATPFGLHEDREGILWVGADQGVWRWRPGPRVFYDLPQPDGIQGIVDSDDGGVLITTTGGVRRLANGKSEVAFALPVSVRDRARNMLRDRDGALWVRTRGGGLVHIRQGRTDVFTQSDGLTGDSVSSLFEDREGNIWVATANGLDRFRELPVVTYSADQGVSRSPDAVLAGRDGSIWFTSGGLNRLNHGQLTMYRQREASAKTQVREIRGSGLPDNNLDSLFQDSRGRIWVSAFEGEVGYLESDRFIRTAAPRGVTNTITEDSDGNLWIAYQDGGVLRLSPGNKVQQVPWETFGSKGSGYQVFDPVRGGLWLGFRQGGISYFRDGQVRASYSAADGLPQGLVNEIRLDGQGALWVATQGGLSRLKDGRIVTLTSKNGLPCDAVHWSLEDDDRALWMGMPCGLVRVARSEIDAWAVSEPRASASGFTVHPTVFDDTDGARMSGGIGGISPHAGKSPDGKLWFGTLDGLGVFDPRRLPFNKLPPPVHIVSFKANGKEAAPDEGLKLSHSSNDLEIDYTALSFTNPDRVRFRYKLEGKDADWQDVGTRRWAFYGGLAPKSYRFRVMASNNDGVWNEAGATWSFSITPAYYQTIWFQGLCAIAFLAFLWGLHRYRLYRVTREYNLRLEERVSERTRIARELHDTLLQGFQGLMLRLQVVDDLLPEGKAKTELEKSLERADQAIAEGRSAVYDLRSSATTRNELGEAVKTLGEELATGDSAAAFHLVLEGESRNLHPIIRDEIYRLTREALRNAFKHARARNIEVELTYAAREFRLRIRDDGEGIPAEILAEGRPGHYGLGGMRERAKQIGGKLDIWSGAGTGTEIELSVPSQIAYSASTEPPKFRFFRQKAG